MNSVAAAPETGATVFYARPYSLDAKGFYFDSYEDYLTKQGGCLDRLGVPVEEFEIQFIDGPNADLMTSCRLDQSTLHWLEDLERLDDWKKPAVFFLLDNGMVCDVGEAISRAEEVCLYEGGLKDAAIDLFDDLYMHTVPESLRWYIDYEAFARDLRLGGDFVEFDYQGETFTCTNANGM